VAAVFPDYSEPVAACPLRTEVSMLEEDDGDGGGRKPEVWKGVLAEFHLHVLRSYAPTYIYIYIYRYIYVSK